jgi:CRISPR system Cascade subunit CasE
MLLSQLTLDRTNRQSMRLVADIYRLHKAVMSGFAAYADSPRVLFRLEPEVVEGMLRLLVQSNVAPAWELFSERCKGLVDARMKEFSPVFRFGDTFRFRLRANPTVKRNGKRYGLVRDDSLEEWLQKKGDRLGVRFNRLMAIDEGYAAGRKEKDERKELVKLKLVRFEGLLSVTEPQDFNLALAQGIGPAKAFGCGLLSLARA